MSSPPKIGDHIKVYGLINPAYIELENVELETNLASIQAVSTEVINCETKLSTMEYSMSKEKSNVIVSVKKIEFLPEKTQFTIVIENHYRDPLYLSQESWRINQNDQTIYNSEVPNIEKKGYEYLPENKSKKYIIDFDTLSGGDFELILTLYNNDDLEIDYPFTFNVSGPNKI